MNIYYIILKFNIVCYVKIWIQASLDKMPLLS